MHVSQESADRGSDPRDPADGGAARHLPRPDAAFDITFSGPIGGAVHVSIHDGDANAFTAYYLYTGCLCDEHVDRDLYGAAPDATGDSDNQPNQHPINKCPHDAA